MSSADWDRPYRRFLDTGRARLHGELPHLRARPARQPDGPTGQRHGRGSGGGPTPTPRRWPTTDRSTTGASTSPRARRPPTTPASTADRHRRGDRGVAGAIAGDAAAASTAPAPRRRTTRRPPGPFWYTVEAWFKTTTNRGGKIVGFGTAQTGNSSAARPTTPLPRQHRAGELRQPAGLATGCSPAAAGSTTGSGTTPSASSPRRDEPLRRRGAGRASRTTPAPAGIATATGGSAATTSAAGPTAPPATTSPAHRRGRRLPPPVDGSARWPTTTARRRTACERGPQGILHAEQNRRVGENGRRGLRGHRRHDHLVRLDRGDGQRKAPARRRPTSTPRPAPTR